MHRRGTGFARFAAAAPRAGSTRRSWAAHREAVPGLHTVAESRETFSEERALGEEREAAVDDERLAADHVGVLRGEEDHGARDVRRNHHAPGRSALLGGAD